MNLLRRSRRSSAPSQSLPSSETFGSQIPRNISEETLLGTNAVIDSPGNYLPDRIADRIYRISSTETHDSNITHFSGAETVVDLVLGHSFSEFNSMRHMPIISVLFQKGFYLFPSEESLTLFKSYNRNVDPGLRCEGLGMPLFQVIAPMLSAFKRKSPLLVIHKFKPLSQNTDIEQQAASVKFEYCKVSCQFLHDGFIKYTLDFTPNGKLDDPMNFKVLIVTSMKCSFADCSYRNTRIRWTGLTQMSSTFGSGFFKLQILNDNSPSLLDGYDNSHPDSVDLVLRDSFASSSSFPPIARFSDRSSTAFPKGRITRHGDIRVFEVSNADFPPDSIKSVTELSEVLTCMSLVLRDQEIRKNHGNPRCYDASTNASIFY